MDALSISLSHRCARHSQRMVYYCQPATVAPDDTVLCRRVSILTIEHKFDMTRLTRQRTRANTIDDPRSNDSTRSEIHWASPVRPTRALAPAGLPHAGTCISAEVEYDRSFVPRPDPRHRLNRRIGPPRSDPQETQGSPDLRYQAEAGECTDTFVFHRFRSGHMNSR